jgi:hypothetical protein
MLCSLGVVGCAKLSHALNIYKNNLLEVLLLNDNNLGDEGALALTSYIKGSQKLCALSIRSNDIGDYGVASIIGAAITSDSLGRLDISEVSTGAIYSYSIPCTDLNTNIWITICLFFLNV